MSQAFVNREAKSLAGEQVNFSFGENWRKFLKGVTPEQVRQSQESVERLTGLTSLEGQRFIDIGCGSGLFSQAAVRLGADRVQSLDVDPNSVACTTSLRARTGTNADRWRIKLGSILDPDIPAMLGTAEVVYSWGVLHHTGALWPAVENTMQMVRPGGMLCLALYNHPEHEQTHMKLKRLYNRLPRSARPLLATAYAGARLKTVTVSQHQNPFTYIRDYGRNSRGMSFWRDVEDWLGGLPCEFASEDDVSQFAEKHGFTMESCFVAPPGANNEYRLRREG